MCGRFYDVHDLDAMFGTFGASGHTRPNYQRRYNITPTQQALVVRDIGELSMMRWGLIPHWAKDEKIGNRLINARAETVREKPVFKAAYADRNRAQKHVARARIILGAADRLTV